MSLGDELGLLIADLRAIYYTAGREVTYVTDKGEIKHYWPKRYWQALKKATDADEVVEFVERIVTREDAARGFGYLEDAGRLDLTVEFLVADETKPYHSLFSAEAVARARERLAEAQDRIASAPTNGNSAGRLEYADRSVAFAVELPQTVMSIDRTPVRLVAGTYNVSLMRHWTSRLDEHGLRAGDVWFLVEGPDGNGAWVRAAECAIPREVN